MTDYSKRIKRLLRELVAEAYEKELSRKLTQLNESFAEWRDGKISSGELSHRIHQYETGASRELFKKYNEGKNDFNVAYAIVTGILDREDIPGEVIEAIDKHIRFYESLKDAGELRFPGE
jgi:DNA primase large subunit